MKLYHYKVCFLLLSCTTAEQYNSDKGPQSTRKIALCLDDEGNCEYLFPVRSFSFEKLCPEVFYRSLCQHTTAGLRHP